MPLPQISQEDLLKVEQLKNKNAPKSLISHEHLLVAELGMFYGWAAVQDVLDDKISLEQMMWLLEGARKISTRDQYNQSAAVFTAVVSANAGKKAGSEFKKNTSHYRKEMKVN